MGAVTLKLKKEIVADIEAGKFSCLRAVAVTYDLDLPCVMKIVRDNQRIGTLPKGLVLPIEELADVPE